MKTPRQALARRGWLFRLVLGSAGGQSQQALPASRGLSADTSSTLQPLQQPSSQSTQQALSQHSAQLQVSPQSAQHSQSSQQTQAQAVEVPAATALVDGMANNPMRPATPRMATRARILVNMFESPW